jgi:hypothetical protein
MGLPTIVIKLGKNFGATNDFINSQEFKNNSDKMLVAIIFELVSKHVTITIYDNILIVNDDSVANTIKIKFCDISSFSLEDKSVDLVVAGSYIYSEINETWLFISSDFICKEGLIFPIELEMYTSGVNIIKYILPNNFYPNGF